MPLPQSGTESTGGQPAAAVPMVDIVESADEVVVYVDLPGFEEDQIDIHADANNLYVTADRSDDPVYDADEGESALLAERPVRLERRISLPSHIDPEEATATREAGVCEISVKKDEQERRHEIGFQ
jgi:HSP20 family protein